MMNPLSLHHIWRNLRFVAYRAMHAQGLPLALSIIGVLFALVFFVIGVTRVVEFRDLGFSKAKVWIFSALHLIGVTLFAASMMLFGADTGRSQMELNGWMLLPAIAILLPLHIYVNVIRRVRYGDILVNARELKR